MVIFALEELIHGLQHGYNNSSFYIVCVFKLFFTSLYALIVIFIAQIVSTS